MTGTFSPSACPASASSFFAASTSRLKYFALGPMSALRGSRCHDSRPAGTALLSEPRPSKRVLISSSRSSASERAWRTRTSLNGGASSRQYMKKSRFCGNSSNWISGFVDATALRSVGDRPLMSIDFARRFATAVASSGTISRSTSSTYGVPAK